MPGGLDKHGPIQRAVPVNSGVLQNLVKKQDKRIQVVSLLITLLPMLYTFLLHSSQDMLQDELRLVCKLLDKASMAAINPMIQYNSKQKHHQLVEEAQMYKLDWLRHLVKSTTEENL